MTDSNINPGAPTVSVIVATFNRPHLLQALLDSLATQSLPPSDFEVIVVDDGSRVPVAPLLSDRRDPYKLSVLTQANTGPAGARNHGIEKARGAIIVITDDDMHLPPEFLAEHKKAHDEGYTLVLGQIACDESLAEKPLFERFHADQLARFVRRYRLAPTTVKGVQVCTGNVSFRRADYLAVGGFDRSLARSEDRELGVRLEKAGAKLFFAEHARTTHGSDHRDLGVWMGRNFLYGVYDSRISKKHPEVANADPWHFIFLVNPASKVLLMLSATVPGAGARLAKASYAVAEKVDQYRTQVPKLERLALAGATLSYGLDYFRGVREEAGSTARALGDFWAHVKQRRARS